MAPFLSLSPKFKPGVGKLWLHLCAGVLWLGVGLMLDEFAARWLQPVERPRMLLLVVAGLSLAGAIYSFGFSKLARKNIQRIRSLPGRRVCLFAFQAWTSYPLVALMIALGIYLRRYSDFPKPLLAVLYLGIGSALFAASLHYFAHIARVLRLAPAEIRES
jgi:hypothetical protein